MNVQIQLMKLILSCLETYLLIFLIEIIMTYSVDSIKFKPFSKIKSKLFYSKNILQMIAQNKKKSFS